MDFADMEMLVMSLIVDAGSARSFAMESIRLAKEGAAGAARESLENGARQMAKAHETQTDLIRQEAQGNHFEMNLFMVHAQDHIMTAMLALDMAREFVGLYERLGGGAL